ncbi:MAG: phosphoribosylanthranilate isomerase [Cyanobacteria bacterium]|nr:phosphoribosylanthranilate isomerase [Cyanobacteriota bacterium]MDA0864973.1 phosphoribosylanthranilate isomerase [Cyanobacteriota bacterium]
MGHPWVKICGLTQPDQAIAVASQGADAIGFICVPASPRYVTVETLQRLGQTLIDQGYGTVERVGVFVDATDDEIAAAITAGQLTTLQLHGQESPERCQQLRQRYPDLRWIKAFRVRSPAVLNTIPTYDAVVDAVLLDAYHPHEFGGTGNTLDWPTLKAFRPRLPWILAGGLTPENIVQALALLSPNGIDLSSGVEDRPGDKNLVRVRQLFAALQGPAPPDMG